jgi:hypothetical protein
MPFIKSILHVVQIWFNTKKILESCHIMYAQNYVENQV